MKENILDKLKKEKEKLETSYEEIIKESKATGKLIEDLNSEITLIESAQKIPQLAIFNNLLFDEKTEFILIKINSEQEFIYKPKIVRVSERSVLLKSSLFIKITKYESQYHISYYKGMITDYFYKQHNIVNASYSLAEVKEIIENITKEALIISTEQNELT